MTKPNLIYWDVGKSTFVSKDIAILSNFFRVRDYTFRTRRKFLYPFEFVRQFFICLWFAPRSSNVMCQFSGYHSYVPFLVAGWFRQKRVVVAGGTDCVSFPSISYGNFQRKYLKWFTRRSFEMADLIIPVHSSLIDYEYTYTKSDFPRQGYKNFTKQIKAKQVIVWNGYDNDFWKPKGVTRKPKSFVTVGANLHSRFAFKLKGIDLYLELATRYPDFEFAIIGGHGIAPELVSSNVKLLPNIPNDKLPEVYSSYTYYAQFSLSEGFPNALTEAILCGCIPVVSNVGGMPLIVHEEQNILKEKSIEQLVSLVDALLVDQPTFDFRNYIVQNFSVENRSQQLIALLTGN